MHTLRDVPIGLLQQLSYEEDDRGGTVSALLVLSHSRPCDHGGSRILDLHLG
jgi:hypothetical protein